jgi:hypothetical protein
MLISQESATIQTSRCGCCCFKRLTRILLNVTAAEGVFLPLTVLRAFPGRKESFLLPRSFRAHQG